MTDEAKHEVSSLVPYRIGTHGEYEFFLQKRDMETTILPGMLGLFGGHLEAGETPEEALKREIHEELCYESSPVFFSRYEARDVIAHLFIEEVGADFESRVHVMEGDYGIFMRLTEVLDSNEVTPLARLVVGQVADSF